MKSLLRTVFASFAASFLLGASAYADDVSVTLSNVHLCCDSCVKGLNTALSGVKATNTADKDAETVVLTAADKLTLQQAVNALVAAGYFGKSSDPEIKMVNESGAKDATVSGADVDGVHLCCGKCANTVNDVLATVPGVTGTNAKKGAKEFTIKGDFNEKAAINALDNAGLAGKVSKK